MLTKADVRRVARRTADVLRAVGYNKFCLFGSAACSLTWDDPSSRVPGDLDFVVFTRDDPEVIKEALDDSNDRFFRKDGKGGPYTVLWYSICWDPEVKIKVDILIHGKKKPLGIPLMPSSAIVSYHHIPVMPFLPLLILKLQGWDDHRRSRKHWHRKKVPQDVDDIEKLLEMANYDEEVDNYPWLQYRQWFLKKANKLIEEYVEEFPDSSDTWRSMGFDVYY